MEILKRFSIFVVCYWGGYVVFSAKSPGLRFIYTGECRASFTSIRAIHFMVLWPTMAMSHSWPGPVWPMSPPFQMNWMLSFTFGEGHLSAWSPPLILFTSQDRFWWRGLGCLSAASACFIHFISESFSLISSVHLDHSLLQQLIQTSITPRAFRKIPASLGKSSELIIALRCILALHWSTALITLVSLCIYCWAIPSWQRSTVLVARGDVCSESRVICPSHRCSCSAHDLIQLLCLPSFTNPTFVRLFLVFGQS